MRTLEEIKARAEKATPGPWEASIAATADGEELATTLEQKASFLALSLNREGSNLWLVDNGGVIPAATGDGPNAKLNAEFIAHARTDVPKLIAALEVVLNLANHEPRFRPRMYGGEYFPASVSADEIIEVITEALA